MLYVSLTTFFGAILIDRNPEKRKPLIWISVCATLLPLLLFKYFNFISQSGASVLQYIGIDVAPVGLEWVVPLGLSFYTFQALGYLWDVYRNKIEVEKNIFDYLLFVAFFLQILCGPISSAGSLLPQLKNPQPFNYQQAVAGMRYVLWGSS